MIFAFSVAEFCAPNVQEQPKSASKRNASQENNEGLSKKKTYALIAAFLGFVGALDSLFLGFYLVSTWLSPLLINDFLFSGYTAGAVAVLSAMMLVCGSCLIWKGRTRMGGRINLAAGIILAIMYVYFAFLITPKILSWLELEGYFLLAPPILSGIIASLLEPFK